MKIKILEREDTEVFPDAADQSNDSLVEIPVVSLLTDSETGHQCLVSSLGSALLW